MGGGLDATADSETTTSVERGPPTSVGSGDGQCNESENENESCNNTIAQEPPAPSLELEKEILDKQLHVEDIKASFFGLYRHATFLDLVLVVVSTFAAIIAGALHPTTPVGRNPHASKWSRRG